MLADIFANAPIQLDELLVAGRNDAILSSLDEIDDFGELGLQFICHESETSFGQGFCGAGCEESCWLALSTFCYKHQDRKYLHLLSTIWTDSTVFLPVFSQISSKMNCKALTNAF